MVAENGHPALLVTTWATVRAWVDITFSSHNGLFSVASTIKYFYGKIQKSLQTGPQIVFHNGNSPSIGKGFI